MTENTYWGHHLMINASKCDHAAITDSNVIYDFTKQLVKDIDMVAYGEPQIINFGTGDKAGYTLVQLIETSNICAHFVNELDEVYLDVFSCKDFNKDAVVKLVKKYFKAKKVNANMITRKA